MRLLLICALVATALASRPFNEHIKTRYDGYKVVEVVPHSTGDLDLLKRWMVEKTEFDFWEAPRHPGQKVVFMLPPYRLSWVSTRLEAAGMEVVVVNNNVQRDIEVEQTEIAKQQMLKKAYDKNNFNTYDDIMSELDKLASECPVGFSCESYSIGKSYQNRDIKVLKISKAGANRKSYWIDGTIHAREWLAPATVMRMAEHLVRDYGADARATEMVDRYDWYILPVMNPDGYVYSWTGDRYWRKNLRPIGGCFGADLNRNFDFRWNTDGVSNNPCSDIYCGPSGGSEPETQAVQNEVLRLADNMLALVTVHAYGNMFMHPWGNTADGWYCDRAVDHADMYRVSEVAAQAIQATYNTRWAYGTSCEVIYATSGGTDDWAKGAAGVKYTFCPEIRGNNFVINRSNIEPSFRELWNGIYAMVNQISAQEGV